MPVHTTEQDFAAALADLAEAHELQRLIVLEQAAADDVIAMLGAR